MTIEEMLSNSKKSYYTIGEAEKIVKEGSNKQLIDATDQSWLMAVSSSEEEGMRDGCGGGETWENIAESCDELSEAWKAAGILARERERRGDPSYE